MYTKFPKALKTIVQFQSSSDPLTMAHLTPFLDHACLIYVLWNIRFLLSKMCHVISLVITTFHWRILFVRLNLIIALLCKEFLNVFGQETVRHNIFKYITFTWHKILLYLTPRIVNTLEALIHSLRVFSSVVMDYGVQYIIRVCKRRGTNPIKCTYVVLFVFIATNITHIEIVSDLTT